MSYTTNLRCIKVLYRPSTFIQETSKGQTLSSFKVAQLRAAINPTNSTLLQLTLLGHMLVNVLNSLSFGYLNVLWTSFLSQWMSEQRRYSATSRKNTTHEMIWRLWLLWRQKPFICNQSGKFSQRNVIFHLRWTMFPCSKGHKLLTYSAP